MTTNHTLPSPTRLEIKEETNTSLNTSTRRMRGLCTMTVTLRTSVLSYKSKFVSSELSMVSLCKNFDDGSHVKKNCLMFNNEHVIEAPFYVLERFKNWPHATFCGPAMDQIFLPTSKKYWWTWH
jgi:hypothetical protein